MPSAFPSPSAEQPRLKGALNHARLWAFHPRLHLLLGKLLARQPLAAPGPADIRQARRILVVKLDEIGDVVLATGFLRELRRQCPGAEITIMVKAACAELLTGLDGCQVQALSPEQEASSSMTSRLWRICRTAWRTWRQAPPDWVLIPRTAADYANAAYYAYWTNAPHVVAHEDFLTDALPPRRALCNHVLPVLAQHEVAAHRGMLRSLGLADAQCTPELTIPPSARDTVQRWLPRLSEKPMFITLGIGAGQPAKIWPLANFRALARQILAQWPSAHLFIVGGPQDQTAGDSLAHALPRTTNLAGHLSLLETAALMEHSSLHVGNDSGPAHLASVAGAATVVISPHPKSGSPAAVASPVRFAPLAHRVQVLQPSPASPDCAPACRSTIPHCILGVTVPQVFAAISDSLAPDRSALEHSLPSAATSATELLCPA